MNKEIFWNIINSFLAGVLILLGALTSNHITIESLGAAIIAGLAVGFTRFADYWKKEEQEYCDKKIMLFEFL